MDEFYRDLLRSIEECLTKMRALQNDVAAMRDSTVDLEWSIATLHNPDVIKEAMDCKAMVQEAEAMYRAISGNSSVEVTETQKPVDG